MTTAHAAGIIPQFDRHDRVGKALSTAGVSRSSFAEYAGIRPETLSRYITGKSAIPIGMLRLVALRTGVPFEWLDTGDAPTPTGGGTTVCVTPVKPSVTGVIPNLQIRNVA